MPNIHIIRAAFREIQKLTPQALNSVYEILSDLSLGEDRNTKKLQGYDHLRRTRSGKWRVIWQVQGQNEIIIIKVALRGDVYDNIFDSRDVTDPKSLEELQNPIEELQKPDGIEPSEHPSYELHSQKEEEWYKYVYGGYRYSPILTFTQKSIFEKPLQLAYQQWVNPYQMQQKEWIVQSAPGTGKTVCATLLACEIASNPSVNVMLIVPEALQREIGEYSEVKKAQQQENFCLGTLRNWLRKVAPSQFQNLATPQEELSALEEAIALARQANRRPLPEEVKATDVLLYQAFILDTENRNGQRNAIYRQSEERGDIEKLESVEPKFWNQAIGDRVCRLEAAKQLKLNPPSPPKTANSSVLIVDEAQDLLLAEVQALMAICETWNSQGHFTSLWFLGDLNQRIQPTDFDWGQLHIGNPLQIQRNYRNSQRILEFANQFIDLAKKCSSGARHPEKVADPQNAFEVGEAVHLLECASEEEANEFLQQLAQQSESKENQRYLLHDLANAVKILSPNVPDGDSRLVVLNAERAKGREFEACVAFRLFAGMGSPSLDEAFQWYTLLTRARSRLLIVATIAEMERVGKEYFESCERIDSQRAIAWITEVASDVDLEQITDDVKERLLQRFDSGYLYWDSYLALELAGVEGESLESWERSAIEKLRKHSCEHLLSELEITHNPMLRCLLRRAMYQSWEAVSEVAELQSEKPQEYERLINAIAQDLELLNLPYEAARVRLKIDQPFPTDYPFPEIASQSGSLVSLLCNDFLSRPFS